MMAGTPLCGRLTRATWAKGPRIDLHFDLRVIVNRAAPLDRALGFRAPSRPRAASAPGKVFPGCRRRRKVLRWGKQFRPKAAADEAVAKALAHQLVKRQERP